MIHSPNAFMGYQYPLAESKAAVILVPYDGTTTYMSGTRNGPKAIIAASSQVEFYDRELDREPADEFGIHTYDAVEPDMDSPENTVKRVEELADEAIAQGKFPIMFGGEHSVSVGMVRALAKKHENLSVLQIDAHADLRDEYGGSRYNHACAMRRILEHVNKASLVGIRSLCREEMDFIKEKKLDVHWGEEFDEKRILSNLTDEVYITIDLDGFDPSECPAVGTPEPGGLRWEQTLKLLRSVASKKKIVGFDIVELMPIPGTVQSDFLAAKLAYKLLGYSLK